MNNNKLIGGKGTSKFNKMYSMSKGVTDGISSSNSELTEAFEKIKSIDSVIENVTEMKELLETTVSNDDLKEVRDEHAESISKLQDALESSEEMQNKQTESISKLQDALESSEEMQNKQTESISKLEKDLNEIKAIVNKMQEMFNNMDE